jgi:hypothetical protein
MSVSRNRELSQFSSFIFVDNNSENIGIATETTPSVGIGTTNPTSKFHVVGNTRLQGNVTVANGTLESSSYTLNGTPLVDATFAQWNFSSGTTNVYRLTGNVGIGTSVFAEKLTVLGNISAGQFISTITSGTAPFVVLSDTQVTNLNASFLRGKIAPNGTIVGTTDSQTLTSKTLTSPILTSPNVNSGGISVVGGVSLSGSTSGITILQAAPAASGTVTIPSATDTLIGKNTADILTNKSISAVSNAITEIGHSNLSSSAGILNTQLANSTISGISLGSNLNSLSFGSYLSSSGSYNGSTARTVSVAGTSINTPNTLVARDISGDFTAGTITVTNLTASQSIQANDVTATDFNSTSDQKLKDNIQTIENSLGIVNSLRGVSFDWKENGKSSLGVIAQEIEKVLPNIVNDTEIKTVNYNALIGVLIEAVKELSKEVEDLKNKIN